MSSGYLDRWVCIFNLHGNPFWFVVLPVSAVPTTALARSRKSVAGAFGTDRQRFGLFFRKENRFLSPLHAKTFT
jgi:hypothetical protein